MKHTFKFFLAVLSATLVLSSCGGAGDSSSLSASSSASSSQASSSSSGVATPEKWRYSRDDVSDFLEYQGELKVVTDSSLRFEVNVGMPVFTRGLSSDDILLYRMEDLSSALASGTRDYADYSVLSSIALPATDIVTSEDFSGFSVSFAGTPGDEYGMLVSKDAIYDGAFLTVEAYEEDDPEITTDPQENFEETYIHDKATWTNVGKFCYWAFGNIAMVVVGIVAKQPAVIASGVLNFFSNIGDQFGGSGPSIKDVLNRLNVIEAKIDDISNKIDENTRALGNAITRAAAAVDADTLATLGLGISDFANYSVSEIDAFNNRYANVIADAYKSYIASQETVNLHVSYDEEKKSWSSTPLGDMSAVDVNYTLDIHSFPKAKAFLEEHNNIVRDGFVDAFREDLVSAVEQSNATLPSSGDAAMDQDLLVECLHSMILEGFSKAYFSENKSKAEDYSDLMHKYAQRITGSNGGVSILQTYLQRFEIQYNFASEMKAPLRAVLVNMLQRLDFCTAEASAALMWAGYSDETMVKEYQKARNAIVDLYAQVEALPSGYSFVVGSKLSGGYYRAKYIPTYSNPGNDCKLNVSFDLTRFYMDNYRRLRYCPASLSNFVAPGEYDSEAIVTRWNLLLASGLAKSDADYVHYLANVGVLQWYDVQAYDGLINIHWIGTDCYRILTGDRTERNMNSADSSLGMTCVAKGNPGGDYFKVDEKVNYQGKKDSDCWSGKYFEGTYLDAKSGISLGKGKVAAWARYAENHHYWINDEYYAFIDNPAGNYFFLIGTPTVASEGGLAL